MRLLELRVESDSKVYPMAFNPAHIVVVQSAHDGQDCRVVTTFGVIYYVKQPYIAVVSDVDAALKEVAP